MFIPSFRSLEVYVRSQRYLKQVQPEEDHARNLVNPLSHSQIPQDAREEVLPDARL